MVLAFNTPGAARRGAARSLEASQACTARRATTGARSAARAFLAISAMMVVAGGCDTRSDAEAALEESSLILKTGVASGGGGGNAAGQVAALEEAAQRLRSIPSDASEPVAAAGSLLLGEARQGVGADQIAEARAMQRTADGLIVELRGLLGVYRRERAREAALRATDFTVQVRGYEATRDQRVAELRETEQTLAGFDARGSELQEEIGSLAERASLLRSQAATLRRELASRSAVEAASRSHETRSIIREADGYDLRRQQLEARFEVLEPQIVEAQANVRQKQDQIRLLGELVEQLRDEEAAARAEADRHAGNAQQAAASIASLIEASGDPARSLTSFRTAQLDDSYEAAIASQEDAVSLARRAARTMRATARTTGAAANRRHAEAIHAYAESLL
ncbi:MAG: hypothetical protein AAF235_11845, partial [Planctomycetota bacterium]